MAAGVNSLSKTFVWILMGLLMLGLAGFGAVNLSGTIRTVATVGDQSVSVDDYARELQREIRAIEAQTGQPMQMSQATALGLDRIALSRLISLASIDHEVASLGVSIGDENLQREIVEIPAFQGVDGNFDREGYRFSLEQAGLSEGEFEDNLRKETARTLVQGAIIAGVEMPDILTDTLANYVGARRSFSVATLTPDALEVPVPAPTQDQIAAFYAANQDQFTLPETKKLTYAQLSPDMLLDQVDVDDAAVRQLFEQREVEFNQPERRLVERLVFADEAEAQDAMAQLEVGGTTFEVLVQDRGLQLADIDLGDLSERELGDAADEIFSAEIGNVVGPLPSDLGPALYRVNGTLAARVTAFEDVQAELRDELAAERARRMIEGRSENISDLLAGGATLEELVDETDMELDQIGWTPDSGEAIAAYDGFRAAATNVTVDDFPEVAFLEDGSIFALRLDDVLPPRPEPLDEARDRVADAWTQTETERALTDEAGSLVTQLATDGDMSALGLTTHVENGLTRTAFLDYAPATFMSDVFDMSENDVRIITGDGAAHIVRLDEILPPAETDELTQMRTILNQQMDQALAQNIFDIFVQDTRTRAQPVIDQRALNAVQTSLQH